MSRVRSSARPGFTLLEVLLAATIGVLLLAALYVSVNMQLHHAQVAREVVLQGTLARGLFTRIGADITPSVTAPNPMFFQQSGGGGGSGGSGSGGGSSGSTAAGGSSGSGTSGGASGGGASSSGSGGGGMSSSGSSSSAAVLYATNPVGPATNYFFVVEGTPTQLTIYISRMPREVMVPPADQTDVLPIVSDLRQITYWLPGDGSQGLARQEIMQVTSDLAQPGIAPPDDPSYIIAPEVRSLTFQYWDGMTWYDNWDGTMVGSDGVTPVGQPMAISVTVELAPPGSGATGKTKTYKQVFVLQTANGAIQQSTSASGVTQQQSISGGS
jgi:prepilin-type N-terminal cleavage/methylation domain-containing protein